MLKTRVINTHNIVLPSYFTVFHYCLCVCGCVFCMSMYYMHACVDIYMCNLHIYVSNVHTGVLLHIPTQLCVH